MTLLARRLQYNVGMRREELDLPAGKSGCSWVCIGTGIVPQSIRQSFREGQLKAIQLKFETHRRIDNSKD